MPSHEDLAESEPPTIDPYEVLAIDKSATAEQVKSAYRKAALKNHPDKVSDDKKSEATEKFQEIAFAYAVLSDPARRKRYDETGSTSEAIVDSDGFSWTDFYRSQYQNAISGDAIEKFAKKYKHSDEEKDDVLAAYEEFEGDMNKLYETVILSNVLEDDDRFRQMIDDAIASEQVPAFPAYTKETKKAKQKRVKAAQAEAREAEDYAKELGVGDKLFKKGKKESEDALAALIQKNQQNRADAIDRLAEKYGAKPKPKAGKKRSKAEADADDLPDDDEFEAIQAKMLEKAKEKSAKKPRSDRNRD